MGRVVNLLPEFSAQELDQIEACRQGDRRALQAVEDAYRGSRSTHGSQPDRDQSRVVWARRELLKRAQRDPLQREHVTEIEP